MAIVVAGSGTQTATISTEHSLNTSTTSGTYVLVVDTTNLANGDTLELRIKTKPLSTSSVRLAYFAAYANVQATPAKYSVPVPCNNYCEVTLKQGAGTSRNFDWCLLRIDG